MDKTTVEIKIQMFVLHYGPEQLINWLDQYYKVISSEDYPLYRKLERESCKACGISLSDMHMFSNAPCTNSKRIIAYLAYHHLHLQTDSIANLLSCSERTINNYVKEATDWIVSPKSNKTFTESYNRVLENFKI